MAVNRFDTPVENQYVSLYTPIPFQELYNIGREYNNRVDQNAERLEQYIQDWKTFSSPITKDVEDYQRIAMNPQITQLIEKVAKNPEELKDTNFRGNLQRAINSVDYTALGRLKQSAQNAENYINTAQKMASQGKYNRNWDLVDFNNYSTLDSGQIFNQVAPIEYQTLQEITNPYVKDLEMSYAGNTDPITGARMPFTSWMAVTEQNIRDIFNSRYNDVISTPQGQMWYRDISRNVLRNNPNATIQDIDNAFVNAMVDSSRQYIKSKPITDDASLAMWKVDQARKAALDRANAKKKSGSTDEVTNKPADFTDTYKLSTTEQYNSGVEGYITDRTREDVNPLIGALRYYESLPSRTPMQEAQVAEYKNAIQQAYDKVRTGDTSPRAQFKYYLDKSAQSNDNKYNLETIADGTKTILDQYSYPITNVGLQNAFNSNIPGLTADNKIQDTLYGTGYQMQRTDGLTLAPVEISRRAGVNLDNGIGKKLLEVQKLFDDNKFSFALLENTNAVMSIPERSKDNSKNISKQRAVVSVVIPLEQLTQKGITEDDLIKMGARIKPSYTYTKSAHQNESIKNSKTETQITVPATVAFDCITDVSQDKLNQEYANLQQNRNRMSTAQAGELVPDVQWNAYDDFDIFNTLMQYNAYGED